MVNRYLGTMGFSRKGMFAKYAWFVVAFNVAVILWGALVRATGSGAGCGSHWPSCQGEVLPLSPTAETIIEFTHRASSGLALLFVAGLLIAAFRLYPRGHRVRFGASISSVFIIIEALVGAGLVLFGWVGDDASPERGLVIAVHLANTFLLLACLAITAWWASGGEWVSLRGQGIALWALSVGLAGVMALGMTGAITALGDTLFPAESLAEGIRQDFARDSHYLVRMRIWHPTLAVVLGFYLVFVSSLLAMLRSDPAIKRIALAFVSLFVVQLLAGMINVLLLAPVWMQLVHLLLADLVWITLVLLSAATLAVPQPETRTAARPAPLVPDE